MPLKRIILSVEEKESCLNSCNFFGGWGTSRILPGRFEDDVTNTSLLYGYTLGDLTRAIDRAFFFYNNIPISLEVLRDIAADSPTQDDRSPLYKYKLEIYSIFIPLNLKKKTEEIIHIISAYIGAIIYGKKKCAFRPPP